MNMYFQNTELLEEYGFIIKFAHHFIPQKMTVELFWLFYV